MFTAQYVVLISIRLQVVRMVQLYAINVLFLDILANVVNQVLIIEILIHLI